MMSSPLHWPVGSQAKSQAVQTGEVTQSRPSFIR